MSPLHRRSLSEYQTFLVTIYTINVTVALTFTLSPVVIWTSFQNVCEFKWFKINGLEFRKHLINELDAMSRGSTEYNRRVLRSNDELAQCAENKLDCHYVSCAVWNVQSLCVYLNHSQWPQPAYFREDMRIVIIGYASAAHVKDLTF